MSWSIEHEEEKPQEFIHSLLLVCCSRQEIDGFNLAHSSCHHQQDDVKTADEKHVLRQRQRGLNANINEKILYALARRRVKFTSFRPYIFFCSTASSLMGENVFNKSINFPED